MLSLPKLLVSHSSQSRKPESRTVGLRLFLLTLSDPELTAVRLKVKLSLCLLK
jgi:hypothetical protein